MTNTPAPRTPAKMAAEVSMSVVFPVSDGSTAATPVLLLFFLRGASDLSSTSFSSLKYTQNYIRSAQ